MKILRRSITPSFFAFAANALLLSALTLTGTGAGAQGLQLSVAQGGGAYVGYPFTITNSVYSYDGYDTQVTNALPASFQIVGASYGYGYFTTNSSSNLVWRLYPPPVEETVEAAITVVPTTSLIFNWEATATDFGYDTNRTVGLRIVVSGPLNISSYDPVHGNVNVTGATRGDFYAIEVSTNLQSNWISVQTNTAPNSNPTFTLQVIPPTPAFIRLKDITSSE